MTRFLTLLCAAGIACGAIAEETAKQDAKAAAPTAEQTAAPEKKVKLSLKPYGFLKGDMYYASGEGALSWNSQHITCASLASDTGGTGIAFTAQHSRFGLNGSIMVKNIEVGGKLELDFFVVAADANAKPRMRQAFAWVKPLQGLDIRIGQQWDLFSPLNPATNNTNANLWYTGNYGFRRPQFQLRYTAPIDVVKPGIQLSIGEATKEATGSKTIGEDNLAGQPMYQGRVNVVLPLKIDIGVSGAYAPFGSDLRTAMWGISADANLPLHKFIALKGEFAYGSNLNNANIFTIGGSGGIGKNAVNTNGVWLNVISKPVKFLNVIGGYGVENVRRVQNPDNPISNTTFFGDLVLILGEYFSFTVEGQRIITAWGGDDATVNVLDVSGKVTF